LLFGGIKLNLNSYLATGQTQVTYTPARELAYQVSTLGQGVLAIFRTIHDAEAFASLYDLPSFSIQIIPFVWPRG